MDLATLVRKVQRRFGDDNEIFITSEDIIDWVNDAQLQMSRDANCLTDQTVVAANTFPWPFTPNVLRIKRVLYGNYPLVPTDVEDLDAKKIGAVDQTNATPQFYYFINQTLNLWPPITDTDITNVTIQYAVMPVAIVTVTDPLEVPESFHEDLVSFCVARAHERNENYRGYELMMDEFNSRIASRRDQTDVQDDSYPVIRDDPYYVTGYGDY